MLVFRSHGCERLTLNMLGFVLFVYIMEPDGYDPSTEPCKSSMIPDFTIAPITPRIGFEPTLNWLTASCFTYQPSWINAEVKRIELSTRQGRHGFQGQLSPWMLTSIFTF